MYQVIKRDGRRVDFDLVRIANAITKAFDAAKIPYNTAIIDLLALQVTADYAGKVRNNEIGVEDIQDSVEAVLQRAGYAAVAKSYILYRKNREKLREMHSTVLDYKKLVDDYLRVSDWRVKENSTVTYSVGGLILSNSGAITANYWLSEIYDEEIGDAHRRADLHLHILRILGILRHEQEFDLFLQPGTQLLVLGEFLARHLLHVGIALVGDDILGLADGVDAGDEALARIHDVAEILVFLRKLDVASLVGDHVGVGDQGRHLLEASLQAVELFQYVVLICHYLSPPQLPHPPWCVLPSCSFSIALPSWVL